MLDEKKIPIRPDVRSALQFLGIDPLEVANEGVMMIVAPSAPEENFIEIGSIIPKGISPVIIKTKLGSERIIHWPDQNQLPRIC